MKNRFLFIIFFVTCFCLSGLICNGQDFVYRPVNPAFGGETFNYQWLLNSAQAQNLIEEPENDSFSFDTGSDLDDFAANLNRSILSQISRQVTLSQFGETGLEEGSYTVGNFQIDVDNTNEGLSITILDTALGEQTQVIIPFF
jgi:Curli production assembly/transport component CsgF.